MYSGLASGMPWRPKLGKLGIWFSNMVATVEAWRMRFPVLGETPSLRRVARISDRGRVSKNRLLDWCEGVYRSTPQASRNSLLQRC